MWKIHLIFVIEITGFIGKFALKTMEWKLISLHFESVFSSKIGLKMKVRRKSAVKIWGVFM